MNDKDKEAFKKFMGENLPFSHYQHYSCSDIVSWQAACEYKQKEINEIELREARTNRGFVELASKFCSLQSEVESAWQDAFEYKQKEIDDLVAENAKLRECVEFYSVNGLSNATAGTIINTKLTHQFYINGEYARQVLKELEEK